MGKDKMIKLIKNLHNASNGQEGEVYCTLFERYINLYNLEDASETYVLKCAKYLNNFDDMIINHLCEASIRYCNDCLETVGEDLKYFDDPRAVLALINPSSLFIPNPEGRNEPAIDLELNCEWEEEHGMEWVIRGDKVLYVGAYHGENPWGEFEPKDNWNYA
ncbi:conserved hypothetical protein [Hyella patelloides LEGE 07179]|uniref:DUF6985 domain-containing protein n=2 Tax=Hyella TaxID=945733 RepID=A0A563VUC9_9CYAN|nr:conserved hypothetical protein [Hyella patelloides LEGE 07179]